MKLSLKKLNSFYDKISSEGYPIADLEILQEMIKNEEEFLKENTSATGGASVGGDTSFSGGMGSVIQSQPSAFPGALNGINWINGGGESGSGDVSVPYNPSGKNRMFQKIPAHMGRNHGSKTGKKSRTKPLDIKALRDIFKKKDTDKKGNRSTTKRVLNFNDFAKDQINKVTKVKEGQTFLASKTYDIPVFQEKIKSHLKGIGSDFKVIGTDLEFYKNGEVLGQIMFRKSFIAIKKLNNKFPKEFKYNQLGHIKSYLNEIYSSYNEGILNRLPDFEFGGKIKRITIRIGSDTIEALSGASIRNEEENDMIELKNNFYFRTDKKNSDLLKKHNIIKIKNINPKKETITLLKNDGSEVEYNFKVKWFSKDDIKWDLDIEDGGYVTWKF